MEIPTTAIKELRELTSAGIMECKRALQETGCDVEAAADMLREKGHAIAKKKEERAADQGLVECYIHTGGRIGALVEVNCESDFVARTPEFKDLAHDIAMQVAATNPKYLSSDDIPEGDDSTEEDCLLLQPFIKDPQKTVNDLLAETIGKVRENIKIRRFARFELGVEGKDA
jgi:elongation factor Ts